MNTLYTKTDVDQIIERLESLTISSERKWGKMNIGQMLAHVNTSLETAMGLNFPKRIFLGRILGNVIKRKVLKSNTMKKNTPTDKNYIFTGIREFEYERKKAITLLQTFYENGAAQCTTHPHPFFGKLTPDEWSILQWKHFDHHLKQFSS